MFLPPGFNREKKKIPALVSVCSWLDCTSSGSLLNAIRSGLFLWSSADFTLQGLQPGLDLFCRSTQLAHYVSTSTHSRKILLLNLGLTASLLLGCGVGFGGLFGVLSPPSSFLLLSPSVGVTVTISGIWHKRLEQHDVADTGKKPEHFV